MTQTIFFAKFDHDVLDISFDLGIFSNYQSAFLTIKNDFEDKFDSYISNIFNMQYKEIDKFQDSFLELYNIYLDIKKSIECSITVEEINLCCMNLKNKLNKISNPICLDQFFTMFSGVYIISKENVLCSPIIKKNDNFKTLQQLENFYKKFQK